jgi:hypothetical protein
MLQAKEEKNVAEGQIKGGLGTRQGQNGTGFLVSVSVLALREGMGNGLILDPSPSRGMSTVGGSAGRVGRHSCERRLRGERGTSGSL